MAYYTGIRAGELLDLKWEYVDFLAQIPLIKIPGEVTKNGRPRTIPLYHAEMVASLKFAYQTRNPGCPSMFQYQGRRLKSYRQGWENARAAAGYPNTLLHDTRRTAVRNMERAGVRRADARQISGHRTESIYIRYDIASEKGALEAARSFAVSRRSNSRDKLREICGIKGPGRLRTKSRQSALNH